MSAFADLYPTIRTMLGDIGAVPGYSNDQLDLGIRMALLDEEGFDESPSQAIAPDITQKVDKRRIALKSAISLLSPSSGQMSYRTPVLSVSRENGRAGHLGYLEDCLRSLVDGDLALAGDDEWDALFNGPSRVSSRLGSFPALNSESL